MTDDRVEDLAKDLLRLIVNGNGGLFPGGPDEAVRDVVRQARVFYEELASPTPRKARKSVVVREDDEEDFDS